MNRILDFIKTRKVWYWLALGATVACLIDFIIYLATGITQFSPNYSSLAIVGMVFALACGIAFLIKPFRALVFGQYVFGLFAFINYITSQINLIANLIYDVDGSTVPASLFAGLIFAFIGFVVALVAGILMKPAKEDTQSARKDATV